MNQVHDDHNCYITVRNIYHSAIVYVEFINMWFKETDQIMMKHLIIVKIRSGTRHELSYINQVN